MTNIESHKGENTLGSRYAKSLLSLIQERASIKSKQIASHDELVARKRFFSLSVADRFNIVHTLSTCNNGFVGVFLSNVLHSDPSPLVRHEAAFVLGCIGGNKQISAVCEALKYDNSFLVRHEAAMALAEIGGFTEIPLLMEKLNDRSIEVSISCKVAIVRIAERIGKPEIIKEMEAKSV